MVHGNVNTERAFVPVQVLANKPVTGVLDVAHHGGRAVNALVVAEESDGALPVNDNALAPLHAFFQTRLHTSLPAAGPVIPITPLLAPRLLLRNRG